MFKRIGHKLILTFGGISTIGLAGLVFFYTNQQHESLYRQNEQMMSKVTESVIEGLQTVMLAGYADIAQDFAGNLQNVAGISDFRILRIDGNEAFLDSQTIDDVNRRKDEELFEPHEDEVVRQILLADNLELRSAIATRKTIQYYTKNESGENFLTFLAPIENKKACHECHGASRPVRGVIKVTTSLSQVENAVEISRRQAFQVSSIFLLIIISVTGVMVRRTIVQPIARVTTAMSSVSRGDLAMKVPVLGRDEISTMARSFNRMSSKLKLTYEGLEEERDKLSTLILSAHDGMVVTDRDGRVVLTNPSAVEILNKSADQIFMDGFNHLFDDPQIMRSAIEKEGYTEVENGDRVLQILASTIQNQESKIIGSAALIRDVTTEKQMQAELRHFATSDSLTGLFNRRYLDEMLAKELERCQRYKHELSIIMFDVDHFKRFNDEHGHDQGDRVLQFLGKAVKKLMRTLDIPCRYGGEEFLMILPETNVEGAMSMAERARKTVANSEVDGLSVTISIGVASYADILVENAQKFIEAADKALYKAKKDGRNCVRLAK
jgi:diguanylate cyclase (GGDEF)-like protein/PAS domain S-box-containing protein